MEKKVCRKCNEVKELDKYWSAGIKNGKKHLRQTCIACYRKVKSRYKVWPSAYASGALAKCRKVGSNNWGNGSKKD